MVTRKNHPSLLNMLIENPLSDLKPYNPLTENEMAMLAAIILFNAGDKCHLVSGLLDKLSNHNLPLR